MTRILACLFARLLPDGPLWERSTRDRLDGLRHDAERARLERRTGRESAVPTPARLAWSRELLRQAGL